MSSSHRFFRIFLAAGLAWLALSAQAEDARFDILEYAVEGNTVLPALAIETAVYPHLGEAKSIADVELARTALEKTYHDHGYLTVFVDIPQQEIASGGVRLRVSEGEVERLRISGSRHHGLSEIKRRVPQLAEGKVPYFPAVEKDLVAVNRSQDSKVTPVMRPGRSPGKVEVDLKVEDHLPLHGELELNDRYSANTSQTRFNAGVRYDNLWQRQHSISLNFQTAPENVEESKVFSGTYSMPLQSGNYLAGYAVFSDSDVSAVGDVNSIGKGTILGLRYILPLRARPGYFHSVTLGLDYKDFDETIALLGADSFNRPVSYLPFTVGYDGTLRADSGGTTQFNLSANFSVRGLSNDEQEFSNKRLGAAPSYLYLRGDLKRTQPLPADWSLFARASGQLAGQPLISNEQFTAGGADSVRGYLEANSLGDDGLSWGLELRAPPWGRKLTPALDELVAYLFTEGATLRVQDAAVGQDDHFDLLSAGLGMRFKWRGGLSGTLDLAYPFQDAGSVLSGDGRAHFRLGYSW